mgnify:CR=1 FL=1
MLLEPYYAFTLETPPEQVGRAISDLRTMNAEFSSPEDHGGLMRICGAVPVAEMNGYMTELVAYTHGRGRYSGRFMGPNSRSIIRSSSCMGIDVAKRLIFTKHRF